MPIITEEHAEEKDRMEFSQSVKIGCLAGATEAVINHPLYVLKMQSQTASKSFRLYQGLLPNMATMILLTGIRLSASTALTEKLNKETQLTQDKKKILSSFIGGSVSSLVGSPMEFVRYRQLGTKSNFYQVTKKLYHEGGFRILFTGLPGTAIRDAIYTLGFYSLAPIIKDYLKQNEKNSLHLTIFSGALAGIFAGIASQPFDMLKVNQQMHFKKKISLKESFKDIYDKQGLSVLYRGSFWRIVRVTSGVAIISTVHEKGNDYYQNQLTTSIRGPK